MGSRDRKVRLGGGESVVAMGNPFSSISISLFFSLGDSVTLRLSSVDSLDLFAGGFLMVDFGSTLGSIVKESISSTSPSTYRIKGKKASTIESRTP